MLGWALAVTLLAATGGAVAVGLYKWTDAQGNVVYSDRPPPRERAGAQRLRSLERRIDAERPPAEHGPAPATRVVRSRYDCEQAKRLAEHYSQPDQEFYTQDENGQFVRSSPEQVRASADEWRAVAQTLCADGVEVRPD